MNEEGRPGSLVTIIGVTVSTTFSMVLRSNAKGPKDSLETSLWDNRK